MNTRNFAIACWLAVGLLASPVMGKPPDSADGDYQEELPRIAPTAVDNALDTFEIAEGFRLDLAAHEPNVVDPIAMAFDADGRLLVIEMRGYSEQASENLGRVRLLTDTDRDGRFDASTIYADGLSWPTAVCCYDGGAFVAAAPDIWFFQDKDGDGRAEVKRKVFTGFSRGNVQGLVNTLLWGPDNRIHGATSSSGAAMKQVGPEEKAVNLRGRDFSFDPRTLELRPESGGGQHGMSFNDWGEKFVCSNSDHLQMVMFEDRYAARNRFLPVPSARVSIAADGPQADVFRASPVEPWRIVRTRLRTQGIVPGPVEGGGKAAGYFTGATGATICRGDAFDAKQLRNMAIIGDVGSNLVHRKRLERDDVGYIGRRVDEKSELIASKDIWFRPVQFANGPDGALYIADMYREVIEHPKSLPPAIKKHLDLTSGRDRGRIYRLVPEGFQRPSVPKMSKYSTTQLVAALDHPNAWHRETAARLLYERRDMRSRKPLEQIARDGKSAQGRIAALYALAGLDLLSGETLVEALRDEHERVRQHAVRLSEPLAGDSPLLRGALFKLTEDPSLAVRYQLAFSLGELSGPQRDGALATLLRSDGQDTWLRLAVATSLHEGSGNVLRAVCDEEDFMQSPHASAVLQQLAAQIGKQQKPEDIAEVIGVLAANGKANAAVSASILRGLNAREGSALRARIDAATGGQAEQQIETLVAGAARQAADESLPVNQRVEAIALMRLGSPDDVRPHLSRLLSPEEPQPIQHAALDALASFDGVATAELIIERWQSFTPQLRRRAGDALFSREAWVAIALDALDKEQVPMADFQREHFARFESSSDAQLAQRVKKVLSQRRVSPRAEVVANYARVITSAGNSKNGLAAFTKHCAACHKVGNVGHAVGPPLAAMRSRGAEAILVNVLDPNREVNPQYVSYTVVTNRGRTFSGMIIAESAGSITLSRGQGEQQTILRGDIDTINSTGKSLMPEEFEKEIDQQTMGDLLAFLLGAKESDK